VHDWAGVPRLYQVEGMAKAAIAAKLGMSRTTVHRLLDLDPRHAATAAASPAPAAPCPVAGVVCATPGCLEPRRLAVRWASGVMCGG
jgi:hypothetical protein